ncbi:MAG: hypothetical protein LBF80_00180 [Spirochaetaceae bacterium]|nr:hypothetical protein [Spirochaetaceae bacterium]
MEQHIEICSKCRETLESYKKASVFLKGAEEGASCAASMEAVRTRVWERINSRAAVPRTRCQPAFFFPRIPSTVLAAMAGAAAAVIIIFVTTLLTPGDGSSSDGQSALSAAAENFEGIAVSSDYDIDIPDITPIPNMDTILRYLETDDTSNIVIIKLPERKKFNRYGEPAFIKNAADSGREPKN